MTEDEFRSHLADHGYGDERVLRYDAHHTPHLHNHDFSAMGMVTSGALTIVREDEATPFGVGDWYEVAAGCVHAEPTGDEPATTLLGVKHT